MNAQGPTQSIHVVLAACLWACGGSGGAHAPLSPEAAKVHYTTSQVPARACKRLGGARVSGRDADPKIAERRAVDAAREQAVELGGNVVVRLEQTTGTIDGAGGIEAEVVELLDVYRCDDAGAAIR